MAPGVSWSFAFCGDKPDVTRAFRIVSEIPIQDALNIEPHFVGTKETGGKKGFWVALSFLPKADPQTNAALLDLQKRTILVILASTGMPLDSLSLEALGDRDIFALVFARGEQKRIANNLLTNYMSWIHTGNPALVEQLPF